MSYGYKKYYNNYNRGYPRKRYYNNRYTQYQPPTVPQTHTIARTEAKKVVYSMVESKRFDLTLAVSNIDYTGFVSSFTNGHTEGTDDLQYVGDKIKCTHLTVRGNIVGADTTQMVRLIVVKAHTPTAPTSATLLQSVGNIRSPLSARDANYEKVYITLYDRTFSLVPGSASLQQLFKISLPGKMLGDISYEDGGTGVIETGGLYMLAISDSAVAAHPTIQWESRLHYKDA